MVNVGLLLGKGLIHIVSWEVILDFVRNRKNLLKTINKIVHYLM